MCFRRTLDGWAFRLGRRHVLVLWQRSTLAPGGMRRALCLGPLEIYTRRW